MTSLWVEGAGAVGPLGFGLEKFDAAGRIAKEAKYETPRLVPSDLPVRDGFPPAATRWLDASSLWWCQAASRAAGEAVGAGCGQVVGLGWGSIQPVREIESAFHGRGFSAIPPALFPFSVGNAPAGQASILLKLRGGAVTLNAKEAAGLAAAVEACRLVKAGLMSEAVAGGVDHLDPFLLGILKHLRPKGAAPLGEGAYALKITSSDEKPGGALCRVAGWSQAGEPSPSHRYPEIAPLLEKMAEEINARFGWDASRADMLFLPGEIPSLEKASMDWAGRRCPRGRVVNVQRILGACGASSAGAACIAAIALSRREAGRALIMAVATGGAAYALALEKVENAGRT